MPLPAPPPSRTVENLGPNKADRDRAPDDVHYLKAAEWNRAMDYIVLLYNAVNALLLASSTVELQDAYNNAALGTNFAPVRVRLSGILKGVVYTDASPPVGELLLGVSKSDGSDPYGFWIHGLRLFNSPTAIHSPPNIAIQMMSAQAVANGAAYVFDTANGYNTAEKIFSIRTSTFERWSFGGLGQFNFYDPLGLAGTIQYGFEPLYDGTGAVICKTSKTGGMSLLPTSDAVGSLGYSTRKWMGVFARFYASNIANYAYAASIELDLHRGEIATIAPLTGNVAISDVINKEIGATLTIIFVQDAGGNRQLTGLPADFHLHRPPFRLSHEPNAVDTLTVRWTGADWIEVGRKQQKPRELAVAITALSAGTLTLKAWRDPEIQLYSGTLTNIMTVEVDPAGAEQGDRFELIFDDATGVTTSVVNPLLIKIAGGGTLAGYAVAKTLRGRILLFHDGAAWQISTQGTTYT